MLSHPIRIVAIVLFSLMTTVIKYNLTSEVFIDNINTTTSTTRLNGVSNNNDDDNNNNNKEFLIDNIRQPNAVSIPSSSSTVSVATPDIGLSVTPSSDKEFKEYMHKQRIGRRLEYIQQQITNSLHIRNNPSNVTTPSLTRLPDVLVQKLLIHPTTVVPSDEVYEPSENQEGSGRRQVVLFPEEDTVNCVRSGIVSQEDVLCLTFKLSDDLLSAATTSAVIWVEKNHLAVLSSDDQSQANFFVYEMMPWNVRQPISKSPHGQQKSMDKDGWFQIDITGMVKGWQLFKNLKHRTIVIGCDICRPSLRQVTADDDEMTTKRRRATKLNEDNEAIIDNCTDSFIANENNRRIVDNKIFLNNSRHHHKQNVGTFLLLSTEPEKSTRWKRGVDCISGQKECCREDLFVNFSELNDKYKMIYYPASFNAYICKGNCYYHSFTDVQTPYAGILAYFRDRYNIPSACCTPTKFSSLEVFYASDTSTVEKTYIPNVVVEGCGCI